MDTQKTHTSTAFSPARMRGVTMIELMIALAIAGIVLAFALPSFENSARNSAIRSSTMDLVTTMNTARAQAVALRRQVTVAANAAGWSDGWQIQYTADVAEDDRTFSIPSGVNLVEGGANTSVVFNPMGLPSTQLVFSICDGRADETGRRVTISRSGRVNTEDLNPCL